jgi:hypothetical protein
MGSLGENFFLALSADGEMVFVIIHNAPSSDREILYNELLLPAIDAAEL